MWRTLCQSVVGSFHLQMGLPCQDYGSYQVLGHDVLIGAVADGLFWFLCGNEVYTDRISAK